jgi:hypothetical protein
MSWARAAATALEGAVRCLGGPCLSGPQRAFVLLTWRMTGHPVRAR